MAVRIVWSQNHINQRPEAGQPLSFTDCRSSKIYEIKFRSHAGVRVEPWPPPLLPFPTLKHASILGNYRRRADVAVSIYGEALCQSGLWISFCVHIRRRWGPPSHTRGRLPPGSLPGAMANLDTGATAPEFLNGLRMGFCLCHVDSSRNPDEPRIRDLHLGTDCPG